MQGAEQEQKGSPTGRISRWPFVVLGIIVCPAFAGLSLMGGMFQTMFYTRGCALHGPEETVATGGAVLTIVGGLLGSVGACTFVSAVAIRGLRRTGKASPWLVAWGSLAGAGAAALATFVLHTGLAVLYGRARGELAGVAVVCAAGVGLALGVFFGLLAWAAAAMAEPSGGARVEPARREETPPPRRRIRRWPFVVLGLMVCVPVGAFGFLSAMTLERAILGGLLGLLGGGAWSAVFITLAVHYLRTTGKASAKLVVWGALITVGMAVLAAYVEGVREAFELTFVAGAGLGLGAMFGMLVWGAAALARARAEEPAPTRGPLVPA